MINKYSNITNFAVTSIVILVLVISVLVYLKDDSYLAQPANPDGDNAASVSTSTPIDNTLATTAPAIKADENKVPVTKPIVPADSGVRFTGILESVNTGCFADGECYVVVGGKHVTLLVGWYQGIQGSIIGADGIGDLETRVGEIVSVYAKFNGQTYTILGSEDYFIELSDISPSNPGDDSVGKPVVGNGCMIGGCSNQICGEASQGDGMVSTCEWREQYACYQTAKCERQATGKCGWTETSELKMCLMKNQ